MSDPLSATHRLAPLLERCLDELVALQRDASAPNRFFQELLAAPVRCLPAESATVWLRTTEHDWTQLSFRHTDLNGGLQSATVPQPPDWVTNVLSATAMSPVTIEGSTGVMIAGPLHQAGPVIGVLAVNVSAECPLPMTTLVSFCNALADLTGEYLAQQELRRLRSHQADRHRWEEWTAELSTATRLSQLAGMIAHDGRGLAEADRVTVVRLRSKQPQVLAVSGVDTVDSHAPFVLALNSVAGELKSVKTPRVLSHDQPPGPSPAWDHMLSSSGAKTAVVAPLHHPASGVTGVVIAERFDTNPLEEAKVTQLAAAALPWWILLQEIEQPVWHRWFRLRHRRPVSRLGLVAVLTGFLISSLYFIPATLVVTVEGELLPVHRRDLFATANGFVDSISVRHGETVAANQPVAQLRDPALELESTRLAGELATARARLSAVQAARIAPTPGDSAARTQLLSAEEEELKLQCESLAQQMELLTAERNAWTITSPLSGQVLTWDVAARLAGRPVERGQVLLTVGDTAGEWEVHAQLRERDVGHLFATAKDPVGLSVEVAAPNASGRTLTGRIHRVARVAEINERGESTVRVTITLPDQRLTDSRPGTQVWSRIDCGRRSLGYVWFHDLLATLRQQWWLWW